MTDDTPPLTGPDPLDGLDRFLPAVDVDAAATAFGRRRARRARRRRAALALGATAVVVVAGVGVLALQRDDADVVAANGPPATTGDGARIDASASGEGLELSVDAPSAGAVGTRIDLTVHLRNTSDHTIAVGTAGECDNLIAVGVRPQGSDVPAGTEVDVHSTDGPQWNGELGTLADNLRSHTGVRPIAGRRDDNAWVRSVGCTDILLPPETIDPGDERVEHMALDLGWGITEIPADMELVVSSGSVGITGPRVSVTAPFALTDDPDRLASLDPALAADGIPAAPTLAEWAELTREPAPNVDQSWTTDLSWWDGGWELWIDPYYLDGNVTGPLRIRWDPELGAVSDVRTVQSGNGGSTDDPGAPEGYPPDDVRYHAP